MRSHTSLALLIAVGASMPGQAQTKKWVDPTGGMPQKGVVDTIHFETDTAVIVSGQITLKCVVEAMKQDKEIFAVVEGFADGRGDEGYNKRLSEARAKAVTRYMDALGVDNQRINAIGFGRVGRPEDPVTNFSRRKAMIVLRRGSFKGAIITELPSMPLPCDRPGTSGDPNTATIEANGQVFQISVDYAKIRRDFRAEMAAVMAAQEERRMAETQFSAAQGAPVAPNSTTGRPGTGTPQAAVDAPANRRDEKSHAYRITAGFESTILKPAAGIKSETGVGTLEAGWLFSVGNGAIQVGMNGEVGSYRRRGQFDFAYSVLAGPFQGTAFVGWGVVSGSPTDAPLVLGNRQGLLFGGRLGLRWRYIGVGGFYANASSPQAGTGQPAQEPAGCVGADLLFGSENLNLRITGISALSPQHQVLAETPSINSKVGGSAQFFWRMTDNVGLILKAESYPTYATYSSKNEQRFGAAIRFGGGRVTSGAQPNWVDIPTVRMIFPF